MNRRQIYGRYYSQWPHLSSLYASNRELEEDGAYAEHMVGIDNVFESPDEPNGAYKFYMAPREEFVLQSEPQVYSSSGGSLYDKSEEMGVSDSTTSSEYRGSTCKVLVFVFLAFGLIAVIAAAVTLSIILSQDIRHRPSIMEPNVTDNATVPVVESSLKMTNRTFTPELQNKNSTEFKEMESDFCKAIEEMYTRADSPLKDLFESCEVIEFTPGSVVVKYRIKLKPGALSTISALPESMRTFFLSMLGIAGSWNELMVEESSVQEFNLVESPSDSSDTSVSGPIVQTSKTEESSSSLSPSISSESKIMSEILSTQVLSDSTHATDMSRTKMTSQILDTSTLSNYSIIDSSESLLPLASLYSESIVSTSQKILDSSYISSTASGSVSLSSESINSVKFEPSSILDISSTELVSIEPSATELFSIESSRVLSSDVSYASVDKESVTFSVADSTVETSAIFTASITFSLSTTHIRIESERSGISSLLDLSSVGIDSESSFSGMSFSTYEDSKSLVSTSIPSHETSVSSLDQFSDTSKHSTTSSIVIESLLPSESLQPSLMTSLSASYSQDTSRQSVSETSQLSTAQSHLTMSASESVEEMSTTTLLKYNISSSVFDTRYDSITSEDVSTISPSISSTSALLETSLVPSSESKSFHDTEANTKGTSVSQLQQSTPSTVLTTLYSDEISIKSEKSAHIDAVSFTDQITLSSDVLDLSLSSRDISRFSTSVLSSPSSHLSRTDTYSTVSVPYTSGSSLKDFETDSDTINFSSRISLPYVESVSSSTIPSAELPILSSTPADTSYISDMRTVSSTSLMSDITETDISDKLSPALSAEDMATSSSSMFYSHISVSNTESSEMISDLHAISSTQIPETSVQTSIILSKPSDFFTSSAEDLETQSSYFRYSEAEAPSSMLSSTAISSYMESFAGMLSSTESDPLQTISSERLISSVSSFDSTSSVSNEELTISSYSEIDSSVYYQISTELSSDSSQLSSSISKYISLDPSITTLSKESFSMTTATDASSESIASSLISQVTTPSSQIIEFSKSDSLVSPTLSTTMANTATQSIDLTVYHSETSNSSFEPSASGSYWTYSISGDSSDSIGQPSSSGKSEESPLTSMVNSDIIFSTYSSTISTDSYSIHPGSIEPTGSPTGLESSKTVFVSELNESEIATSYPMSESNTVSISFEQMSTNVTKTGSQMDSSITKSKIMSELIGSSQLDITPTTVRDQSTILLSVFESVTDTILQSSFSDLSNISISRHSDIKSSTIYETNSLHTSLAASYMFRSRSMVDASLTSDVSNQNSIEPTSNLFSFSDDQSYTSNIKEASITPSLDTVSVSSYPLSLDASSESASARQTSVQIRSSHLSESTLMSSNIFTSEQNRVNGSDGPSFSTEHASVSSSSSKFSVDTVFHTSIDAYSTFISTAPVATSIFPTSILASSSSGNKETVLEMGSSLYGSLGPTSTYFSVGTDSSVKSSASDTSEINVIQSTTNSSFVSSDSSSIDSVDSSSGSDVYSSIDVASESKSLPASISTYNDSTLMSSLQTETSRSPEFESYSSVPSQSIQSSFQSVSMPVSSTSDIDQYLSQSTYPSIEQSSSPNITVYAHNTLSDSADLSVSSVEASSQRVMDLSDSHTSKTEEILSQSPFSDSYYEGTSYNLLPSSSLLKSSDSSYYTGQYVSTETHVIDDFNETSFAGTLSISTVSSIANATNQQSSELVVTRSETLGSVLQSLPPTLSEETTETFASQTRITGTASMNVSEEATATDTISSSLQHSSLISSLISPSKTSSIDETSNNSVLSESKSFYEIGTSLDSYESISSTQLFSSAVKSESANASSEYMSKIVGSSQMIPALDISTIEASVSLNLPYDNQTVSAISYHSNFVESSLSRLDSNFSSTMDITPSSAAENSTYSVSMTENINMTDVRNETEMSYQSISASGIFRQESSVIATQLLPSLEINITSGVVVSSIKKTVPHEAPSVSTRASTTVFTLSTEGTSSLQGRVSESQINSAINDSYFSLESQTKFDNSMFMSDSLISPTAASSLYVMSIDGNMTEYVSNMSTVPNYMNSSSESDSIDSMADSDESMKTVSSIMPSETLYNETNGYSPPLGEFSLGKLSSSAAFESMLSTTESTFSLNQTENTSKNETFESKSEFNSIENGIDISPSHAMTLNDTAMTESASANDTSQLLWTIEVSQHNTSSNPLEGSEPSEEHLFSSTVSTVPLQSTPAFNESVISLLYTSYNESEMTFTQNEMSSNQTLFQNMTNINSLYSNNNSMSLIEIDIFSSLFHNDTNIQKLTNMSDSVMESSIINSFYSSYFHNSIIGTLSLNDYTISPSNSISTESVSSSVRLTV